MANVLMNSLIQKWQNVLHIREFGNGEAVLRDTEDLLIFLEKHNLSAQFENIVTLLKLALTVPVSSAHDENSARCKQSK